MPGGVGEHTGRAGRAEPGVTRRAAAGAGVCRVPGTGHRRHLASRACRRRFRHLGSVAEGTEGRVRVVGTVSRPGPASPTLEAQAPPHWAARPPSPGSRAGGAAGATRIGRGCGAALACPSAGGVVGSRARRGAACAVSDGGPDSGPHVPLQTLPASALHTEATECREPRTAGGRVHSSDQR